MLLLFIGNIGSGKSTAANILKEMGFLEHSFATPLKEFALSIGFNYEDVYGTQEEKCRINPNFGVSGRQFMQRFGTDVMRANSAFLFDNKVDNIWIRALELKLAKLKDSNVVVSDGRFFDEVNMLKKLGAIVVRLKRKNSTFASLHSSETELNELKADFEFENNGTLEDLKTFLASLVSRFTHISSKSKEEV